MRKKIIATLIIVGLASLAWAATIPPDHIFEADGGLSLLDGTREPISIEASADGTATIRFYKEGVDGWLVVITTGADSLRYLRANDPRIWNVMQTGTDSVYVDLITATEVILTWQ